MSQDKAKPTRRLVLISRADPVICGHAGETRCMAEQALLRGFDDVRIVTWPVALLEAAKFPLKVYGHSLPYSDGITVERPRGVGDTRVIDGRNLAGVTGRLIELFTDGVPTVSMALYLSPHAIAQSDAHRVAKQSGLPCKVTTIAEAVGSDITNVIQACVDENRFGAAAQVLSTYLDADECIAVSEFCRDQIIESAEAIDKLRGTTYADQCRERVNISYPSIDGAALKLHDPHESVKVLAERGLEPGKYILFLSRMVKAKGVDDLIHAYNACKAREDLKLVLVGAGAQEQEYRELAASTPMADRIVFINDMYDTEKPHLLANSAMFTLPTRPLPDFVDTFGVAVVESQLAEGGPVITCDTGGVSEAVGDTAVMVPAFSPEAITQAIDEIHFEWSDEKLVQFKKRGYEHALQFDKEKVFDRLFSRITLPG